MPNIHIVGFKKKKARKLRKKINELMRSIGEAHDACTTTLKKSEVCWCEKGKKGSAAYVAVLNTKPARCKRIGNALSAMLGLDVEQILLIGFQAGKPKKKA